MKILTHTCCAPCANVFVSNLELKTDFFWYNHNIHPVTEYRARRDALMKFANEKKMNLINRNEYGLREFVKAAITNLEKRCTPCYKTRLNITAQTAKKEDYNAFSTTLLASPYQNFDLICALGKEIEAEIGIEFIVRDFRENFRKGVNQAREEGLYIQKYCGCIFSEEDRYIKPRERK